MSTCSFCSSFSLCCISNILALSRFYSILTFWKLDQVFTVLYSHRITHDKYKADFNKCYIAVVMLYWSSIPFLNQHQKNVSPCVFVCTFIHISCMGRWKTLPQKIPTSHSWNMCILPLLEKEPYASVIKLRILWWGDYPGLSEWVHCNQKGPKKREAGMSESERVFRMQEGEYWEPSRSWKRQGNGFLCRVSRKNAPPLTLQFWDFWPPYYKIMNLCFFKPLCSWYFAKTEIGI